MEILKDKKIIVGGLAVIGGIALVAYLLKPKAPRRNSEGFFNAIGKGNSSIKNEFLLPNAFTRKPSLLNPCYIFSKRITPLGQTDYSAKPLGASDELASGITYQDFKNAFYNYPKCKS